MNGSYVLTGPIAGKEFIPNNLIGRVVQVRLAQSRFGDMVFLRHVDNSLHTHENQSFHRVPSEYKEYLDQCFKDVYEDNAKENEYTECGQINPKKGFIIHPKFVKRKRIIGEILSEENNK